MSNSISNQINCSFDSGYTGADYVFGNRNTILMNNGHDNGYDNDIKSKNNVIFGDKNTIQFSNQYGSYCYGQNNLICGSSNNLYGISAERAHHNIIMGQSNTVGLSDCIGQQLQDNFIFGNSINLATKGYVREGNLFAGNSHNTYRNPYSIYGNLIGGKSVNLQGGDIQYNLLVGDTGLNISGKSNLGIGNGSMFSNYSVTIGSGNINGQNLNDIEEYDPTNTYNIGDLCYYTGDNGSDYYRCKENGVTGEFNSSKWDNYYGNNYSYVFGQNNTSDNDFNVIFGEDNTITGKYNAAFGHKNSILNTNTYNSLIFGEQNTAQSSSASFVGGYYGKAEDGTTSFCFSTLCTTPDEFSVVDLTFYFPEADEITDERIIFNTAKSITKVTIKLNYTTRTIEAFKRISAAAISTNSLNSGFS